MRLRCKPLLAHFSEFGPADRANLLGDQFALFVAGRAPLDVYLDMLPALADERDTAVWQETLPRLRALDALARNSPRTAGVSRLRGRSDPAGIRPAWLGRKAGRAFSRYAAATVADRRAGRAG